MNKIVLIAGGAGLLVLAALGVNHANKYATVGTGYKALEVCNESFLANRPLKRILEEDFIRVPDIVHSISVDVDQDKKEVRAALGPLGKSRVVYRDGYACTNVRGELVDIPALEPVANKEWTIADPAKHGFDTVALNAALDKVFENPLPNTRAMVFIRGGELVAERYAPGFDRNMPMLSNSMAKTVSQLAVGAAIEEGLFTLNDRPSIDEWSGDDDPRREITWRHMLQMQTGLEFDETSYVDPFADVPQMQILAHSSTQFAIDKPLIHPPGTFWSYATGTSNALQRGLRVAVEGAGMNYHSFARDQIFEPLGASSVVLTPDSSGEFIGGSYVYATPRDWAKLGQLMLQDGMWEEDRILPRRWSEFASSPASASNNLYGAQLWLNLPSSDIKTTKYFPVLPDTAYWFGGWQGQVVLIVPSLDMVIVHLGRTNPETELVPINEALELVMPTLSSFQE
ncbi:MAG: serine hydrolase [Pseudomonadota bacterium]